LYHKESIELIVYGMGQPTS